MGHWRRMISVGGGVQPKIFKNTKRVEVHRKDSAKVVRDLKQGNIETNVAVENEKGIVSRKGNVWGENGTKDESTRIKHANHPTATNQWRVDIQYS